MKVGPSAKLTVVIPTYNRAPFLERLLGFAREVHFPFWLQVADSSNEENRKQNEAFVGIHSAALGIGYSHFDCGLMEKLFRSVESITTPYCCFWADDDFQLPEGLLSCLCYLDQHEDYGSCMGQFLAVRRNEADTDVFLETYPSRDESSAVERVLRWSENFYSNFYAVYRTPLLLEMLRAATKASCYERCRIIPEVLMGQMALLLGRQKMLEELSIVYQMHPGNDSRVTPCVRDHDTFPGDYRRYRETTAQVFSHATGLPLSEADRLVDQSFRNVHRWTGGRGWIFKKLFENIRRPWFRMQLRRDARRTNPRFTRVKKVQISADDLLLKSGAVAMAMKAIAEHPKGTVRQN
jgi:glycosyltransferase domain-containing protein